MTAAVIKLCRWPCFQTLHSLYVPLMSGEATHKHRLRGRMFRLQGVLCTSSLTLKKTKTSPSLLDLLQNTLILFDATSDQWSAPLLCTFGKRKSHN